MVLPITVYGDPVLRKKCVDVDKNDPTLPQLIADERVGRSFGRTPDWKKAIVTLQEGQTIDLMYARLYLFP